MEKTIAKRFWQEVWNRYVNVQKYKVDGSIKERYKDRSDSYMVSQAIWSMSDKEFEEILQKVKPNSSQH